MLTNDIRTLAKDYRLSLEAENKTQSTVAVYGSAIERFAEWLEARGRSTGVTDINRKDCRGFIDHLLKNRRPATAHNRFRALKTFSAGSSAKARSPSPP
jgi:site-specific recombinase XerD